MFLAKPLRFRADLVCARSYAGRAPFFGAALFLCPADPVRQVDSRIPVCDLAAGIAPPASTSARTRLASCPRKSRCVTLPCELLWRIPVSEPTLRSCRGSVDTVACDPAPAPVSQTSLAQALDVRLTCGFVPRFASMLQSIRGGGPSRPARRMQAGLGEEREPACHLRPPRVCRHLAHSSMYGATCPPAFRSVASHRDNVSSPCAGHRAPFSCTQHRLHEEAVGFMRYESYGKAIGPPARRCRSVGKTLRICVPRALDDGKMLAKCVPGRQSVAIFSLHASRKRPRTGKSPVRGKIRTPCIRNELALAGYARHASEMPRKSPPEDTPREDPARKGHFSLRGPLESRMARRSCHPLTLDLSATRRLR